MEKDSSICLEYIDYENIKNVSQFQDKWSHFIDFIMDYKKVYEIIKNFIPKSVCIKYLLSIIDKNKEILAVLNGNGSQVLAGNGAWISSTVANANYAN